MNKLLLFVLPFLLAIVVFLGALYLLDKNVKKGALQVTATPKSKVYLNNKLIGQTPLCACEGKDMLEPGEYTIRLVPLQQDLTPYEEKITIAPLVLSVMDRTFGKGGFSQGKTITLTKIEDNNKVELSIVSFPDDVQVFIDQSFLGKTPISSKDITASDHELKFVKDGYIEKIIRIRTVAGYKLSVIASLGVLADLKQKATEEASLQATSSAVTLVSTIVILNTPTGFLRVRTDPSINASESARVKPGEKFELLDEKDGFFEIKLLDGTTGWISDLYAKKEE